MEAEQSKRSLLKTITWRITASLDTFVIAWIITGDWKMGGSIAGIEVITKIFFYYFHERIWNKIKWGKKMVVVILTFVLFPQQNKLQSHLLQLF